LPGNYRIEDDSLNEVLPVSDRFNSNVAALRVLRQVEEEVRSPGPHEKDILAGYSGWSGMSELFAYDPRQAWRPRPSRPIDTRNYRQKIFWGQHEEFDGTFDGIF